MYWKCIENSTIFVYFLKTCICKEGNRSTSANRLPFCAPLKVPRPILRKTWLGLEDKSIFQLKYQCVCPHCFCQFFANDFKKRSKHRGQTHWYFSWKIVLSSRPSHVFRSNTPENVAGSRGQIYFSIEISMRLPSLFLSVFREWFQKAIKTPRANALIFQLKNSFVLQTQPRFPEYGSRNF